MTHTPESSPRWIGFPQVVALLDVVKDPCSEAMNRPVGLVEMGIVRGVLVRPGRIEVTLCLTEPTCLYAMQISDTVRARLGGELGDDVEVSVRFDAQLESGLWTEERMLAGARDRLHDRRRADLAHAPSTQVSLELTAKDGHVSHR